LLLPDTLPLSARNAEPLLTVRESSPSEEEWLLREHLELKSYVPLVLPTSSASVWEPSTDVMLLDALPSLPVKPITADTVLPTPRESELIALESPVPSVPVKLTSADTVLPTPRESELIALESPVPKDLLTSELMPSEREPNSFADAWP